MRTVLVLGGPNGHLIGFGMRNNAAFHYMVELAKRVSLEVEANPTLKSLSINSQNADVYIEGLSAETKREFELLRAAICLR